MQPSVLLIEDDSELRDSLLEYLALANLKITAVGSALEFYQTLNTSTYDVAIVDIGLPDQSGFEITQYLRSNTNTGIIILTARGALEDRIKGYELGADLYLVKPVDGRELLTVVRNLLERCNSRAGSAHSKEPGQWVLDQESWCLHTPNLVSIKLTAKEICFLEILIHENGKPVPREELKKVLGYDVKQDDNRALDALVRRLRKKIADESDHEAPIKTSHAIGYSFSASATTDLANPPEPVEQQS
jgi:DNA-binding response OmpR family regulator